MQIFTNVDSTAFTLNGTRYVKNFIVMKVGNTNIQVLNAYDSSLQILSSTHFSEVQVDGNTYGSQALLMNALANVCFTKGVGGGTAIIQNNVGLFNTTIQYAFTTPSNTLLPSEIVTKINLTYAYAVSEIQTPYFFQFVRPALQEGSSTPIQKKYVFMFTGGKGIYGLNQTPVASTQFKLIVESVLNPSDIIDDDTAVINYLGEIENGDYITVANESEWDFFDTDYTYYFSYVTDGVLYYVVFVGEPGLYGNENQLFVEADFIDSTNSDALPYIPTLQEVITQGSTATTSNNISINITGAGKLTYNGSEVLNTAKIGVANGVVPTDGANKIPVSYLPNAVMIYKGVWNLSTNTPALSNGTGTAGWVYKVTGASTPTNFNFGAGNIQLTNGDFVIYSDTGTWEKSDGSDAVASVNGYQGVVSLTYSDVGAAAASHTHPISQVTSLQTALDGKANTNGSNASGSWPINITGNADYATNAINWNGRPADWSPTGVDSVPLNTLLGLDNVGTARRYSPTVIKPWLGIGITDVSGLSAALAGKANIEGDNATGIWPISVLGYSETLKTSAGGTTKFHWEDGGAMPTFVWGANGIDDSYVYNPSAFNVSSAGNWRTTYVSDFNAPTGYRLLESDTATPTNTPSGAWGQGIQFSTNNNPSYINQLVFNSAGALSTRTKFAGTWGGWTTVPIDDSKLLHTTGNETKTGDLTLSDSILRYIKSGGGVQWETQVEADNSLSFTNLFQTETPYLSISETGIVNMASANVVLGDITAKFKKIKSASIPIPSGADRWVKLFTSSSENNMLARIDCNMTSSNSVQAFTVDIRGGYYDSTDPYYPPFIEVTNGTYNERLLQVMVLKESGRLAVYLKIKSTDQDVSLYWNLDSNDNSDFTVNNSVTTPSSTTGSFVLPTSSFVKANNYGHTESRGGYIGIGTSAPAYKLDVNGDAHVKTILNFDDGNWALRRNASTSAFNIYRSTGYEFTITDSGNVGIGFSAPAHKLHVNGDAEFIGQVYIPAGTTTSSAVNVLQLNESLADKADADGSNATGTWDIDISGRANDSVKLGGYQYNDTESIDIDNFIVNYDGTIHPMSVPNAQIKLGVDAVRTNLTVAFTSTAAGAYSTTSSITVAGAQVGDFVQIVTNLSYNGGIFYHGYVTSANTMSIHRFNGSTGGLSSGNIDMKIKLTR
jgi:hypothetical protein